MAFGGGGGGGGTAQPAASLCLPADSQATVKYMTLPSQQ
jgi:hypothetical protein